jgi:hypothetical protein
LPPKAAKKEPGSVLLGLEGFFGMGFSAFFGMGFEAGAGVGAGAGAAAFDFLVDFLLAPFGLMY